ncbi:hypothetical protein [Vibrio nereis]|uniref:Uncharacterized protein n=1 Tax=Vibrio nereis TaxID=693 RepID=A0A0M0HI65_VIBNE
MTERNSSIISFQVTLNDILLVVLIVVTFLTYLVAKDSLELEKEKFSPYFVQTEYFPIQEILDTAETAYLFENEGEKRGSYKFYAASNEFWLELDGDNKGKRRSIELGYGLGKGEAQRLNFKVYMPTGKQMPSLASYRFTLTTPTQGVIHDKSYCYQLIEGKKYVNVGCPTSNN